MADLLPLLPSKLPANAPSIVQPALPPIAQAAMTGSLHPLLGLPAPTSPDVTENPRISAVSSDPLTTRKDQLESDLYNRSNPVKPTSTLGKIGHVAAGIGNVLGDIFAPSTMALIPGTDLHNQVIEARDKHDLSQVSQLESQQAQREQEAATTEYTKQKPEIEKAKVLQKLTSSLAPKGIIATMNPDGTIDTEDDTDSQAYKDRVATTNLRQAQAEREQVLSQIGQPGSPLYEQKERQLADIDKRISIAQQALGLRGAEVGLKRDAYNERAFGTDAQGNPLPGSLVLPTGETVGTGNAENVRPTTSQRDAAGRADVMQSLGRHIAQEMDDPEVAPYLGAGAGRIAEIEGQGGVLPEKVSRLRNDLISYGAFQAGLHPVRGIGALEYFDKVLGGLGQNPEQLRGKLLSNADTAGLAQGEGSPSIATGGKNSKTITPRNPNPTPKIGDTKTFPNGKTGKWDGKGYVAQ